ncbi:MAG TPA: DUF1674 domain-containing protein [Magnetospirillaceae bacterium]|jgi:hypothetical protein
MPAAMLKEKPMEPDKSNKPADPGKPKTAVPEPAASKPPRETGGPKGLEPTRYNDWERGGRCIDF